MSKKFLKAQKKKKEPSQDVQKKFALALGHHMAKQFTHAENLYREILQRAPGHADCAYNLGMILQNTGRVKEALATFQKLAATHPDYADAHNNIGLIMEQSGNVDEALRHYKKAAETRPNYIYFYNLASPFYKLGIYREAEKYLRESLKLNPDYPEANLNISIILLKVGNLDDAEYFAKKAVSLRPDYWDAKFNLAKIYAEKKMHREAISLLNEILSKDPNNAKAHAVLLHQLQNACMWQEIAKMLPGIERETESIMETVGELGITPFMALTIYDNPQKNLRIARARSNYVKNSVARISQEFSFADRKKEKKKIIIGYMSADFRRHAFGHITKHLFESHNRDRFQINAYSFSANDGSEVRKYYENTADNFMDMVGLSDIESAKKIYSDQVDILLDCTGYTAGGRIEISAMRPAPVNINIWGFPGTTGADWMDYIIADRTVIPEEHEKYYSEKIIHLPETLQINHINEKISDKKMLRSDFGLPEDAFVFCSFNQPYKIEPAMFSAWMRLLKKIENSVLWLRAENNLARENIWQYAQSAGIGKNRIIFADKIAERSDYFKRLQLADLCLDTRIYNGGSTTMDSLWAGVPVLTLLGNHYASRMSAGIINGAGMQELISMNMEEYENLAKELATNPEKLKTIRDKLWKNRNTCPLFDTQRFVKNLEKAYENIWQNYVAGNPAKQILIEE